MAMREELAGLLKPEGASSTARWARAAQAIESLAQARSLDEVVDLLRGAARRIVGADGIAVVLRDGDLCHYVAEDAQEPLWAGQRFPAETCVSGWAMLHNQTAAIPDIFDDPRVPVAAYRSTFVRSMLMVPIGYKQPVAALGAYWSEPGQPHATEVALLETLARAASTALENGRLFGSLERLNGELEQRVLDRTAELERAQEILRQTQKMEIIGQLTGNVAHDFNNLLSPIMSSLDLVLGGRAAPETVARTATVAMEAAETAKTLVQRLLAFARRQPLQTTAVDLSALAEGMRDLLASTMGARTELMIDAEPGLPAIKADKQQLEMAILNLAVNARDAMPDGGALSLSIRRAEEGLPDRLAPGDYLVLSVRDNGCGMDARTLQAATEPFFTTKSTGQGTGLGLSMVDGLVSQLGGRLDIASQPGAGTEIRMFLPVVRVAPPPVEAESEPEQRDRSRGMLLLVDDDALVRMSTCDMLEDLGYSVVEAESAQEALDLIEERGFRPDILVTDHVMPGMTGAELALRIRTDHPGIAIMIVSGYQGIDLIAPDIVRLSKPYRQAHLDASIAAARAQLKGAAH
jgi:signal transduction histidine kinase/CheY-like chemotaxis protein